MEFGVQMNKTNKPWLTEPDKDYFEYKGYLCRMHRSIQGTWLGYVGIPKDSYYAMDDNHEKLQVHGGITFVGTSRDKETDLEDPLLWLGFDCDHYYDISPKWFEFRELIESIPEESRNEEQNSMLEALNGFMELGFQMAGGEVKYRTHEYAKSELMKLVDQIAA